MEISRSIKRSNKSDTKKFILALLIYATTITTFDYLTHNFAPAHQNNEKQGQNHQLQGEQIQGEQIQGEHVPIPVYHRPDREINEPSLSEPSRGEALSSSRGRELVVESTSYGPTGNRTFSGTWPVEGKTIAVDNEKIKIGSRVYIQELGKEGLGNWYLAEDKIPASSVRRGAIIDIFRNDEKSCWEWGRRDVRVKVIPPQE